jgi:hypothetical protein
MLLSNTQNTRDIKFALSPAHPGGVRRRPSRVTKAPAQPGDAVPAQPGKRGPSPAGEERSGPSRIRICRPSQGGDICRQSYTLCRPGPLYSGRESCLLAFYYPAHIIRYIQCILVIIKGDWYTRGYIPTLPRGHKVCIVPRWPGSRQRLRLLYSGPT